MAIAGVGGDKHIYDIIPTHCKTYATQVNNVILAQDNYSLADSFH